MFVRCGYPLTAQIVNDTIITNEQRASLKKLLSEFGYNPTYSEISSLFELEDPKKRTLYDKVLHLLALHVMECKSWGGSERKIYTNRIESLLNVEAWVVDKQMVKTGKRIAGYNSQGYFDLYPEYTPAYLDNLETHVILTLDMVDRAMYISDSSERFQIEARNVVKETNEHNG